MAFAGLLGGDEFFDAAQLWMAWFPLRAGTGADIRDGNRREPPARRLYPRHRIGPIFHGQTRMIRTAIAGESRARELPPLGPAGQISVPLKLVRLSLSPGRKQMAG